MSGKAFMYVISHEHAYHENLGLAKMKQAWHNGLRVSAKWTSTVAEENDCDTLGQIQNQGITLGTVVL